jgi:hypothetical protein
MRENRNGYVILVRKLEGRGELGDICIDGRIIIKQILA